MCRKLGPHKKYYDSDESEGTGTSYDTWDVTYACEKSSLVTASCWAQRAAGNCETSSGQDNTCSGGGSCRSTSPDCVSTPNSRSCHWDNTKPERCECFKSSKSPPTSFDPTFSNNLQNEYTLTIAKTTFTNALQGTKVTQVGGAVGTLKIPVRGGVTTLVVVGDAGAVFKAVGAVTVDDSGTEVVANVVSAEGLEGVSCSLINPGIRAQCDPEMDVIFVTDASDSIVQSVSPKCYDTSTSQLIDCSSSSATMLSVYDEYAKARDFAKKFMSYFKVNSNAVKLGYVAFASDIVVVDSQGKQLCANGLAKEGTKYSATAGAVRYSSACSAPYATESDLQAVLSSDATRAARQIDMKYFTGGTKMFLGMSVARQVLALGKLPGRSQLVIFVTDGEDSFADDMLDQAAKLKSSGVRIVTIAAGGVVTRARGKGTSPIINKDPRGALAVLRDSATNCVCTRPNGSPCIGDKAAGGWICMSSAKCVGDCYQSANYQDLVDTVVVDIVRQNCEILTTITPGVICSSRSETLIAKGQGFGASEPKAGQIKFKVGGTCMLIVGNTPFFC